MKLYQFKLEMKKRKEGEVVDVTYYCPFCDIYWTEPVKVSADIPNNWCYRCGKEVEAV
jgi:hypothetical protein